MRISPLTRFPHPVLSEETKDYTSGRFAAELSVSESKTTGKLTITYQVTLDEPHLKVLLDQSKVNIGLFVVCRRTYYNQLHALPEDSGSIEFARGELKDNVVLRPIISATQRIQEYTASNLHEEYGDKAWRFMPADILAIGEQISIHVGLEKLAPMETIFNFEVLDTIPEGEIRVLLESDKIAIVTNKETGKKIHAMRGTGLGRIALLNGVYLPVVMEVLASLSDGLEQYKNKRWYPVFTAKCTHLNINLEQPDLLEDAQTLLRSPLGTLLCAREFRPT